MFTEQTYEEALQSLGTGRTETMNLLQNHSSDFKLLVSHVESNIENLEKCNVYFKDFVSKVMANESKSGHLELAILFLCLGKYQDSYNLARRMEVTDTTHQEWPLSLEQFLLATQLRPSQGEDLDIQEEVDWILPKPHQIPCSPYQFLFIGQFIKHITIT